MVELKSFGTKKTYFLKSRKEANGINQPKYTEHPRVLPDSDSNFSISVENPMWKWINEEIGKLSKIRVNTFTLVFNDKNIEQNFDDWWIQRNLVTFRVGVVIVLVLRSSPTFSLSRSFLVQNSEWWRGCFDMDLQQSFGCSFLHSVFSRDSRRFDSGVRFLFQS